MMLPFRRHGLPILLAAVSACSLLTAPLTAADKVVESARDIPIAYDVDVVVVGGTTGAVSAALAAAEEGASVFLAAPRPYLGEDICGTLRLWLNEDEKPNTPLEQKVFQSAPSPQQFVGGVSFKYEADQPSAPVHRDTKPPSRLTDGVWGNAAKDSVQFDNDVTIIANLGGNKRIKELHLLTFQRDGEFEVAEMHVWTSLDGKLWRDLGTVKNEMLNSSGNENVPVPLSLTVKQPLSYVKLQIKKTERAARMLLGELIVAEDRPEVAKVPGVPNPPTPMQVKIALDQALIDAGVKFLYGSPVTDVLRDKEGNLAGIVMTNRAGRQAVKAKVVIDGTMHATAARIAGVKFTPFPAGTQTFERIVVGGEPKEADNLTVEKAPVRFVSKEGFHDVFVYSLKLPMPDNSFASLMEAEHIARDLTFDAALVDESDVLYQVPVDSLVPEAKPHSTSEIFHSNADLAAPGEKRCYVLTSFTNTDRKTAAEFLRPLNLMRIGSLVGAAAAKQLQQFSVSDPITVAGESAQGADSSVEVLEFLQGARPTDHGRPTVKSPARSLPVLGEYDVVIVGGGTGGAPAAIGAARKGAKTLLIEYQDHLGGVGTLGLISTYYHGYRKGYTAEVDEAVAAMGGPKRRGGWNPVTKREYWRVEARKAGADVWFSTLGSGAIMRQGVVAGVVVTTPLGRGVVLAKKVIDSTGNCDIAAAAGAETITTSAEHVAMQGTGLSPRALATGYTNTDYSFSDESDPVDQWRMIVTARRKFKNSYDLSTFIDSRERRRIQGEVFITPLDLINGRTYYDTIAMHQSNFDTHGYTVHPIFLINFPDKTSMTVPVPLRALLPRGLEGILVTGLGISAHRDAMPILRMQPCIQNQGYAAGIAAATAAKEGIPFRSLDIQELQKQLVEIDSLPQEIIGQKDSSTQPEQAVAQAVDSVVNEYQGLALIMDQGQMALPLLRKAYQAADTQEKKIIYANILGMLGDPTGNKTLIEVIDGSEWDAGWNFRGMGQFGGSLSRLDSLIIALGRSGDKQALPTILRKVEQLDPTKEFSHHRAVAMSLEALRDPSAAKPLADLLSKEGMTGFAITEIGVETQSEGNEHRSQPLREVILARALYRCGDYNGLAEKILREYEKDLRGLFAKHSQAVLSERKQASSR